MEATRVLDGKHVGERGQIADAGHLTQQLGLGVGAPGKGFDLLVQFLDLVTKHGNDAEHRSQGGQQKLGHMVEHLAREPIRRAPR